MKTDLKNNCSTTADLINFQKGIEHLNKSLEKGLPVLVGVQKLKRKNVTEKWQTRCTSYDNNPRSTNHYIVIVSKKENNYRYYEVGVGTENELAGTAETNIFYSQSNMLESKNINKKKYRITDIRVNKID